MQDSPKGYYVTHSLVFRFPALCSKPTAAWGNKIMWGELCRGHVGYDVLPFSLLRALLPKPMKRGCAHGDAPPFRTGSYDDLGKTVAVR